jgi:rubrerythrin
MSQKFKKKVEDFVCEKCGQSIKGNGYTNHCPNCLWSKHVDNFPGDRESNCGGMMEPIDVIHETGEDRLVHKCLKCGHIKRNKMSLDDNYDAIQDIVKRKAERLAVGK